MPRVHRFQVKRSDQAQRDFDAQTPDSVRRAIEASGHAPYSPVDERVWIQVIVADVSGVTDEREYLIDAARQLATRLTNQTGVATIFGDWQIDEAGARQLGGDLARLADDEEFRVS